MVAKWKKERIGIYKKYVTPQFRAIRYLKFIYGIVPDGESKEKVASTIRKHFEKYGSLIKKDEVIKAFCVDNKLHAKEVNQKLEQISNSRKENYKKKPFSYEEYAKKADEFYKTNEWRKVRYEVLREQGGRCQCCGRSAKDGVVLHVDHIIPLSKDWSKRLDKDNLQILCEDCNLGKSNTDSIRW